MSNHWGIVDFHDPVAEFARESLDTIMEVKVASADKSEERRKDREAIQEKKKIALVLDRKITEFWLESQD